MNGIEEFEFKEFVKPKYNYSLTNFLCWEYIYVHPAIMIYIIIIEIFMKNW